jgi:hypothetical protein
MNGISDYDAQFIILNNIQSKPCISRILEENLMHYYRLSNQTKL